MCHSLKSKTVHGVFWSLLERVGQQGIQLVISIILARLLLPAQFGLIAMLAIFMAIAKLQEKLDQTIPESRLERLPILGGTLP